MKWKPLLIAIVLLAREASPQPLALVEDNVLGYVSPETGFGTTVSMVRPAPDNTRFMVVYREWSRMNVIDETMRILDLRGIRDLGHSRDLRLQNRNLRWKDSDTLEDWTTGDLYHLSKQNGELISQIELKTQSVDSSTAILPGAKEFGLRFPEERPLKLFKDFSGLGLYDGWGHEIRFLERDMYVFGLSVKKGDSLVEILSDTRSGSPRTFIDPKTGNEFSDRSVGWDTDGTIYDLDYDATIGRLFIRHGIAFSAYYLDSGRMVTFPGRAGRDDGDDLAEYRVVFPVHGHPYYVMTSRLMRKNRSPSSFSRHEEPFIPLGLTVDVVDENFKIVQSIHPFFGIDNQEDFEKHIMGPLRWRSDCEVKVCVSEKFVTLITFGIDKEGRLVKGLKVYKPNAE